MKKVLLTLLSFYFVALGSVAAQPSTAAAAPTRSASDVLSLFSDAYTNVSGTDWFPNWGQSTTVTDIMVAGNTTKQYNNLNYQGVAFAGSVNAASMTHLHLDIWTPNCTAFQVFLINPGPIEQAYTITPSLSGWNSIDIPLSHYNAIALNNIFQLKLVGTPFGSSTVYLDNIYFWKPAGAPLLSNFTVPAKVVGDPDFALTAPTSNSAGAFTYTSSNTSVATISGNMVTVVGVGTAVITATQAADGAYSSGSITANLVVSLAPPSTAAPTPTRDAADVLSLFSDAYTNVSGTNWFPNWGQSTTVTDIMVATNPTKKYDNLNYQGVVFAGSVNASTMTNLHLDIWTPNCNSFQVFLINPGPVEQAYTITPSLSGWNSIDIPLSHYNTIALNNIFQLKFVGTTGSTVYLDNIYFWKPVGVAPTLSNFTVPAKLVGDAPFALTDPTSNSAGAFTYMSSNTSVATISGNMVTVVGVGTAVITATQAADGGYISGNITANLVVSFPPPSVAAPTPTQPQANVLSLFSNAYTNCAIDTWSAGWDQANVADAQVASNDVKLYTNLVFAGIEFTTTTVNATDAMNFHIDIWTPNATTFKIKLVDFGANGGYGGGDDSEHELTYTPAQGQWVSYDIPMSDFGGLTARAHLAQMILVASNSTVYVDNVYFHSSTPLPINLVTFEGSFKEKKTTLNWKTASERNNQGFTIERSANGKNFESIGEVKGAGNSNTVQNYTFIDENPLNGVNYYRLRQRDFDGKTDFSKVITVLGNQSGGIFVKNTVAADRLDITVNSDDATVVSIFNVAGQVVLSESVQGTQSLYVGNLAAGVYFIRTETGAAVRFIKR